MDEVIGPPMFPGVDPTVVNLKTADEALLAEQVERAVRRETLGAVHDLEVAVDGDEISLHGQCPSFYCKQLAQHAAMLLADGRTVVNQIEVV